MFKKMNNREVKLFLSLVFQEAEEALKGELLFLFNKGKISERVLAEYFPVQYSEAKAYLGKKRLFDKNNYLLCYALDQGCKLCKINSFKAETFAGKTVKKLYVSCDVGTVEVQAGELLGPVNLGDVVLVKGDTAVFKLSQKEITQLNKVL